MRVTQLLRQPDSLPQKRRIYNLTYLSNPTVRTTARKQICLKDTWIGVGPLQPPGVGRITNGYEQFNGYNGAADALFLCGTKLLVTAGRRRHAKVNSNVYLLDCLTQLLSAV